MSSEVRGRYQAVTGSPIPGVPCFGIRLQQGYLTGVDFLFHVSPGFVDAAARPAVAAIEAYLYHSLAPNDLSLRPSGTAYQQRVWAELCRIPSGEVCTYGELARKLHSSARAIAGACRANPLPLLIPCHRVVSADGAGGYLGQRAGTALEIKRWLLQHEGHV